MFVHISLYHTVANILTENIKVRKKYEHKIIINWAISYCSEFILKHSRFKHWSWKIIIWVTKFSFGCILFPKALVSIRLANLIHYSIAWYTLTLQSFLSAFHKFLEFVVLCSVLWDSALLQTFNFKILFYAHVLTEIALKSTS